MRRRRFATVVIWILFVMAGSVYADEAKTAPVDAPHGRQGLEKLLLGWLEIPKSIIQVTNESHNPFWGLTGGAVKGIAKAFPRTITGFCETTSGNVTERTEQ